MGDLIAEQARKDPERPAIESWDGTFTYGDVESKSSQLAAHLVSLGVGVGTNVPLCFEKSRWTVIAVLAVMKAGGTFALMDPSQPEGRLRTIVEQTGANLIITSKLQENLGSQIVANSAAIRVTVSDEHFASYNNNDKNNAVFDLPVVPPTTNLYIQFTSGSTGKPKGVLVTHANYTSGAVPRADIVGYRAHSRVLDFASYAFDVCIDCMLCTLSVGGCLCIPSDADRVNDLSGAIRKMGVNMAHMTPSVARVLDADIIPSLEVLGLGGEAISAGDAAKWSKSTKVINAYGPSECTVGCAVNGDVGAESTKPQVSIGRGVGAALWIVDPADHNRLAPVGTIGELLVEGAIVGPGYLGDPAKTAAVFISDPKWLLAGSPTHPGRKGRLYKTGDLVQYDADGTIVFVGRGDQQVKLRGQRIELAEIEYHMRDILPPGTRVVAEVIKPGGPTAESTLVAFVAERAGLVKDSEELVGSLSPSLRDALANMGRFLAVHLPIYMIPAAYIPLQTMPLLVSAKTDRKRLRELGSSLSRKDIAGFAAAATERREPSTPMEKTLAEVWKEVLGSDVEVSANDNFFISGGDSLRAMKLVAAARNRQVALSVGEVLSYPILSEMALVAKPHAGDTIVEIPPFSLLDPQWTEESARVDCAALCEIEVSRIEDVYPCTPLQEALMALSAKVSEAYVAQRVVELADAEAAQQLRKAFQIASVDCPILRTRIVQVPGRGLMQVIVKDDFDYRSPSDQSLSEYLVADRNEHVALGRPLVRYGVILGDEAHGEKSQFVLTMHHALYDGWSMPLVVERVNRAYSGLTTQRPAEFKHFIRYLGEMGREESETYWRERLQGAVSEQFPALPWPGYQQQADSLLEHYVDTGRPTAGFTIATAIRGAWALLVSLYTSSNDVVFGETLTGRNAPIAGVEEIEGPMIATIPVRVGVDPNSTVAEYLQDIHNQSVSGIPHEHFGLQHIRRLSPDAREACELRTGLVLHPNADDSDTSSAAKQPADGFVPAGDAEAAEEALKFNTYALMLVCSLDPQGFLIMASFDSKTVASPRMERILTQLGALVRQFCQHPDTHCGDLAILAEQDVQEIAQLSHVSTENAAVSALIPSGAKAARTWIVDPSNIERLVPAGGVGELIVQCEGDVVVDSLQNPKWLGASQHGQLIKTGKLAKYDSNGSLVIVERKSPIDVSRPRRQQKQLSLSSAKQKKLRQIWSRVIGIGEEEISLNDSFFQLGGDSIGAMKLVSELRAEGLEITVAEIFKHRTLYDMTTVLKEAKPAEDSVPEEKPNPFSLLESSDVEAFIRDTVRPALGQQDAIIRDILPTRPLQQVAVRGTSQLPRYSARYELFHLDGMIGNAINTKQLFQSCQELVARNEILRTVFVENAEDASQCYAVVLEELPVAIEQYEIEGDIGSFVHKLCDVDVQTRMPLGSAFVKFMFVRGEGAQSCLILRISHAQYDEICLVKLLRQLADLYEGRKVTDSVPFSSFVYHIMRKNIPRSIPYWRELLQGSSLSVLRPDKPLHSRVPADITRTIDISARLKDITIATLPTAAWALCLARRLASRDVLFGEVVSGRNIDLPNADAVMGPTWQYVPVRVKFEPDWKGIDLLDYVQYQHIASAQHECIGLAEIRRECTDWPEDVDWFDSVVHQDVYHVEELKFGGAGCRMETVYPHYEPLREWKCQAFVKGDSLTLEIVTFEDWIDVAKELLDDLEGIMTQLVNRPSEVLFA
ncbi:NRPS [Diatrype stigma]|uniref:NRPS n=1 Tax=Diatrype stigma TaxID=117547 RepID=A0AAN9UTI7_9PEZI